MVKKLNTVGWGLIVIITVLAISVLFKANEPRQASVTMEQKKEVMFNNIKNLSGIYYGHYLSYDYNFFISTSRIDNINERTGKYPYIISLDYYDLTTRRAYYGSVNQVLINHSNNGGLAALSMHMINPENMQSVRNRSINIRNMITPGTPSNEVFNQELNTVADGMGQLQDNNVVILFRPFHEMNGGWFWWGNKNATDYKDMWIYTYNFFANRGLHNLLWVYSPNDNIAGSYLTYYPGDQYVDIVALDHYGPNIENITGYNELSTLNKPMGFSEIGHIGGGATNEVYNYSSFRYLNSFKNQYPQMKFFVSYLGRWSINYTTNLSETLNDGYIYDLSRAVSLNTYPAVIENNTLQNNTLINETNETTNNINETVVIPPKHIDYNLVLLVALIALLIYALAVEKNE